MGPGAGGAAWPTSGWAWVSFPSAHRACPTSVLSCPWSLGTTSGTTLCALCPGAATGLPSCWALLAPPLGTSLARRGWGKGPRWVHDGQVSMSGLGWVGLAAGELGGPGLWPHLPASASTRVKWASSWAWAVCASCRSKPQFPQLRRDTKGDGATPSAVCGEMDQPVSWPFSFSLPRPSFLWGLPTATQLPRLRLPTPPGQPPTHPVPSRPREGGEGAAHLSAVELARAEEHGSQLLARGHPLPRLFLSPRGIPQEAPAFTAGPFRERLSAPSSPGRCAVTGSFWGALLEGVGDRGLDLHWQGSPTWGRKWGLWRMEVTRLECWGASWRSGPEMRPADLHSDSGLCALKSPQVRGWERLGSQSGGGCPQGGALWAHSLVRVGGAWRS